MQRLASKLIGQPVYSMHAAGKIGIIQNLLVRQQDLKLELLAINLLESPDTHYLLPSDIRFEDTSKIIIDSHDKLSVPSELLRHQQIIKQPFVLFGCKVVTQSGKKLGKVRDFSLHTADFLVTKIHVQGNFWERLMRDALMVDRTDVVDVEPGKITVKDNWAKVRSVVTKPLPATK